MVSKILIERKETMIKSVAKLSLLVILTGVYATLQHSIAIAATSKSVACCSSGSATCCGASCSAGGGICQANG